jgi:hypothetical protein
LNLAQTEYVCLWHQDDVMIPDNLEKKVEVLDSYTNVGFVHSNIYRIDAEGRIIGEHWKEDTRKDYLRRGGDFFLQMIGGATLVPCPSVVARKECYNRVGGFRPELPFTCDYEMWMRISLYFDVACLGKPLVKYRCHGANESHRFYSTTRWLEQELLARLLVLRMHGHRISGVKTIRKTVRKAAAIRALSCTQHDFCHGELRRAWAYWWLAMKTWPLMLPTLRGLGLLGRLLLGLRATDICRRIKYNLVLQKQ